MIGLRPEDRCPVKDGDELFNSPIADADKWGEVKFRFDVAIGESGPLMCQPLGQKLERLTEQVSALVKDLEAVLE